MKKRIFSLLLALCLVAALASPMALAAGNLDEITRYDIAVTLQEDGSALLVYDIDWLVLDSTSEGPLEWVKIGVPNMNIDQLTANSDSIQRIQPYPEGGSYVRLDLDKRYRAGETVNLAFSLHCTHLYELEADGTVNYQLTPGWFDAAETQNFTLAWQDAGQQRILETSTTKNSPATLTEKGELALVTLDHLRTGERLTFTVTYPSDAGFAAAPLDPQLTRSNAEGHGREQGETDLSRILMVIIFTIVIILVMCRRFSGDYWLGGFGGFWGGGHHHHHHRHGPGGPGSPMGGGGGGFGGLGGGESRGAGAGRRGSSGGGCACACVSCACACACAGGGRAGCSAKDFKQGFSTQKLLNALKQTEQEAPTHDQ